MTFRLENISRWIWAILGAGVGALFALAYQPPDFHSTMDNLGSQKLFEQRVLKSDEAGPRLTNVIIHPPELAQGTVVHPVTFFDRSFSRPIYFQAPHPYKPMLDPRRQPSDAKLAISSIEEYLTAASGTSGVTFQSAWWETKSLRLSAATAAGVFVLGLLWPTALNLAAFGSFRRPKSEKGISLRNVRNRPATPSPKPAEADLAELEALDAELEANLKADAEPVSPTVAPTPPPVEIKTLNSSPAEPAAAGPEHDQAEFGAKADDFYPTARPSTREHA